MDTISFLSRMIELGRERAASCAAQMTNAFDSLNGFMGVYYELAKMELHQRGLDTPTVRSFAIDKALERIDARLDCADFVIPALVRMLHEHRGTRLDEAVAQRIDRSLIGYKYWLDEPGSIKACYFTENHQILFHSAEYLVGQLYPDAVFPNNGMTGRQHQEHATVFLRRWLNWRERFGFSEWLTQGYYMEDILGLVCLMQYADEPDIRTHCCMLIDLLVQPGQTVAAGTHEVAAVCDIDQLNSCLNWRSAAPDGDSFSCMTEPSFPVHGRHTGYLIAGPLASNDDTQIQRCMPGQLFEGEKGLVTWRPHLMDTALRPYVESNLFGRWTYPLGVTRYGMWQAGHELNDPSLNTYVLQHLRQVTGIHDHALYDQALYGFPGVNQQICWLDALDDCGSFASMMLEVAPEDADSRKLADRIARYMLDEQPRTSTGAYCRRDDTIWADDMYMSGPFLCRYSMLTGEDRAINECADQLLKYKELLYLSEKQVMSHMRCLRNGEKNCIPWCRGNGWVLFTLSELLMRLPQVHPKRDELLCFFRQLTQGYMKLQDETGLWHQILDGPETYLESSATAMFICAFARGLRYGWYEPAVRTDVLNSLERAWNGLCHVAIDGSGNLYGVCRGSGFSFSRAYYRKLMWNFNDTHGIGIVMLAGTEYLRIAKQTAPEAARS